ncbi:MAG: RNA polymerase sigma factor [Candidatus Krumholzibacteria bacterium]|nr:RNA polymerase sigma factor [Candidatus Krumholzibacteria bacterium]
MDDKPSQAPEPGERLPAASESARRVDALAEDRALLEAVRRRERNALGRFFDAAFPYVYAVALRVTGDHERAEDAAQGVFLKVHRAADRLDPTRSPRAWLTTITVNACRDAHRRSAARPAASLDSLAVEPAAPGVAADDALLGREQAERLERALRALDEPLRSVVILHDYCGYGHDTIAELIGASHDAVRKRYSRALAKLRELLTSERE